MTIQKKAQQGFTLIELMIVIAIVGILAAIALPAYQDYIVRSKTSEPLAALAEAKTTISEYVAANGGFPTAATSFGVNTAVRSAESEILEQIVITPAAPTAGDILYITAEVDQCVWNGTTCTTSAASGTGAFSLSGSTNADGSMRWACVPKGQGGTTTGAMATKYLPANCRG
jgi:type IV pilus assembly protein PilA